MGAELILQNNITGLLVINNGLAGIDGKSAYEVYTENGGSLSEIDFNRLIGELPYILGNHNEIGNRDVGGAHPASAVTATVEGLSGQTLEEVLIDISSKLIYVPPTTSFSPVIISATELNNSLIEAYSIVEV